ncbi:MAG: HetP family heterocyst commitment protein [Moorea sp. SIO3C2]|nr:HetP family heterocyst commitment protein [Moorena sp. SIO3C2]
MTYRIPSANTKLDKVMDTDKFSEIEEAILDGKYSWACVLMLRLAGHNPLDYMPSRTYSRLLKQNRDMILQKQASMMSNGTKALNARQRLSQIKDLAYVETLGKKTSQVHGGDQEQQFIAELEEEESMLKKLADYLRRDCLVSLW